MKIMTITNGLNEITEHYALTDEEVATISKFLKLCYIEENLLRCETTIDFVDEIEVKKF